MKRAVSSVFRIAIMATSLSMAQTVPERYRDMVFDTCSVVRDIPYGPGSVHLMDLYAPPSGDSLNDRPLVIFIHGGGFKSNTKSGAYQARVCKSLARMGYVTASIEYRLTDPIPDSVAYFEAMMRGLHDGKAAVRFFRKNAVVYGVDPGRIYVTGSSAGSIIALHMAYLDSSEVPSWVRWKNVDDTFEGDGGTPGYSSAVQGVINCWGAIGDTSWMRGSTIPVFSVHGESDTTVYCERVPAYKIFRYGSKHINDAAARLGIVTGVRLFPNTGHTLDNDPSKQESAIRDFSRWLYLLRIAGAKKQR